jgi:hypothetical protein
VALAMRTFYWMVVLRDECSSSFSAVSCGIWSAESAPRRDYFKLKSTSHREQPSEMTVPREQADDGTSQTTKVLMDENDCLRALSPSIFEI